MPDGTVIWTAPTGRVYRTSPDGYDLFPPLRPACRAPTPRRRTPGCAGRRTCNVNLDDLRWDRPDIDCEPQQARGIRRNLQLDETVAVTRPGSSGDHTLPFHQQAARLTLQDGDRRIRACACAVWVPDMRAAAVGTGRSRRGWCDRPARSGRSRSPCRRASCWDTGSEVLIRGPRNLSSRRRRLRNCLKSKLNRSMTSRACSRGIMSHRGGVIPGSAHRALGEQFLCAARAEHSRRLRGVQTCIPETVPGATGRS